MDSICYSSKEIDLKIGDSSQVSTHSELVSDDTLRLNEMDDLDQLGRDDNFMEVSLADSSSKKGSSKHLFVSEQLYMFSPHMERKIATNQHYTSTFEQNNDSILAEGNKFKTNVSSGLALPSLEDGLSSGSELDTPCSAPKYDHCLVNRSGASLSVSPPSDGLSVHVIESSIHSTSVSPIETTGLPKPLMSPPLVQSIWGIVNDIKQTLSDNTVEKSPHLSETVVGHVSLEPENSISQDDSRHTGRRIFDEGKVVERISLSRNSVCEKIVTRASIENGMNVFERTEEPHPTSSNVSQICRSSSLSAKGGRHSQKWSFNAPVETAISSSGDEDEYDDESDDTEPDIIYQDPDQTSTPKRLTLKELALKASQSKAVVDLNRRKRNGQKSSRNASEKQPEISVDPRKTDTAATDDFASDSDTDQLLENQYQIEKPVYMPELKRDADHQIRVEREKRVREASIRYSGDTLLRGVMFRVNYLGSTQMVPECQPSRNSRMMQAHEAVGRVKAPEGEDQPNVPVELFVSPDRLMIFDFDAKKSLLMDHPLRTVSYVADIGDIFILMARRPSVAPENSSDTQKSSEKHANSDSSSDSNDSQSTSNGSTSDDSSQKRGCAQGAPSKLICHVLETSDARLIAHSVGQAFQAAYVEFLREQGIDDPNSISQPNYEDVLNQQEIFCDELSLFSDKNRYKQITIPKQRGEPLGVVIVATGWGSLLPTVLLANMNPSGPAARCGQLNIGNQIISINGDSLVGLPLNDCRQKVKNCRNQTSVRLTLVDSSPVVEVLIRRPSVAYPLGFSVQDGVICSLLRGGIAERGGIRVDHRIIEINGESVVAVSHERIVHMLANATGEIHIRTMPTSVFRLLTGQDAPHYI